MTSLLQMLYLQNYMTILHYLSGKVVQYAHMMSLRGNKYILVIYVNIFFISQCDVLSLSWVTCILSEPPADIESGLKCYDKSLTSHIPSRPTPTHPNMKFTQRSCPQAQHQNTF